MTEADREHRSLGANVVRHLLPHRRPFLFVDRIKRYRLGENRTIEAALQVSLSHPVFDGHFPHWSIWPGVYVVEGLGQTTQLLATLDAIRRAGAERGDEMLGLRTLDALDAAYALRPGPGPTEEGLALLEEISSTPIVGLASRIDVRFVEPVLPGCRIDYRADWTLDQKGVFGFEVEASVAGRPVVRGELGASINTRIRRS
jgi:3-hydroxymyristoyl/3-hydroxydecanoyl-(acyl carrier protein) dehydratase